MGGYLPPGAASPADTLLGCVRSVLLPLEALTGIRSRHVTEGREFSIDLARKALAQCLSRSRYAPEDIDLIIACNICRYDGPNLQFSFEPNTSFTLCEELGLVNAISFDVSNACAGVVTGLYVANAFIEQGIARTAVVVSGEYISHIAETAQKEVDGRDDPRVACLTLGDAGAAVLLAPSPSAAVGVQDLEMYTVGAHSRLCIAQPSSEPHGGIIMLTDAIALSAATVKEAVPHALKVMRRNGWSVDDLQHLIMHQTSRLSIQQAVRVVERETSRRLPRSLNVVDNLATCGNTATTTHVVAAVHEVESGRINTGDRVMFSSTGSGLTVG